MNIYIMTRGRVGKQRTLKSIPPEWLPNTWLVVPEEEEGKHEHKTLAVPSYVNNYSKKMEWILSIVKQSYYDFYEPDVDSPKCLILDDNLVFSRRHPDGKLITERDPNHLSQMFHKISNMLDNFTAVGIHPRQGGNRVPPESIPVKLVGKMICAQGINVKHLGRIPNLSRHPILSDLELNLHILSKGSPNALLTSFCLDWGTCQAPGGCSEYRTAEMQKKAVEEIASRYPAYVKVVKKTNKGDNWLGGDERYDYTVQWKKLYRDSCAELGIDPAV